jgi:hypothetical protein
VTTDLTAMVPPDDSGSDSFARFCYQAHIAFALCLACARAEEGIISVVAEHFEDIAVECIDGWRLLQIKTRDPEQGPWRLAHVTKQGGALHTLYRSHCALPDAPITLELLLEGPVASGDQISLLETHEGRCDPTLHATIRDRLNIAGDECSSFVSRLRLVKNLPARSAIIAQNMLLLGRRGAHLTVNVLDAMYTAVVQKVHEAMALDLHREEWLDAVFRPEQASEAVRLRYEAKRLTRPILEPLVQALASPPKFLLKRMVESGSPRPSMLEQKLLAGGATPGLVTIAKQLRANASLREYEAVATTIWESGDLLDDIRQRLLIRVEGLLAAHERDDRPAVEVWNGLRAELQLAATTVDGLGVFYQDPDLLLGEACEMSDQCTFGWGISDA